MTQAQRLKEAGLRLASAGRAERLRYARRVARGIAERGDRTCNADQVQERLADLWGFGPDWLGPAAGALFRTPDWTFTGERIESRQPGNHAREIKVWRLVT